ncbi:MAG: anion transporter [Zetaproteobacteria bacterium CG2_30_46_52]|nr:MAG: anion transporter [Zetaproteobacteria bacterium CG2_30_46_52]
MFSETNRYQHKKITIALSLALLVFAIATTTFNTQQSALLAVIMLLVALWTNEGLPMAAASLLPIVLFPALSILDTKATALNYAHPIIFLFLGGFLIAIAVEKSGLHTWISNKMLQLFPNTGRGIILSLVITSGLLSSILSNTTTTLLLISIALYLSDSIKLKMRFALAIAYGASVGGIMTPIGTPPNLILLGFMQEHSLPAIPFMQWMMLVAPLSIVMFIVVGLVLSIGVKGETLPIMSEPKPLTVDQKKVLGLIGFLMLLLLVNAPIRPYWQGLGLNESGILLGLGLLLFAPPFNILNWMQDKNQIPFQIMFLFGAGFSIANAFGATGLAHEVANYIISLTTLPTILLLLAIAAIVTFTTEITSNTALISIMLPIIYAVTQQAGIDSTLFMMVGTICASFAFMLPIATPPNAIAMSSGIVDVKTMMQFGLLFNLVGIVLITAFALLFWQPFLGS